MSTLYANNVRVLRRDQEIRLSFMDDGSGVVDVVMTVENARMLAANLAGYFPPEEKK